MNTKLKITLLICLLVFFSATDVFAQRWKEIKGKHFIVYFLRDRDNAEDVLEKSEEYYNKIAEDLGYARHSNFWAWSKRVKIYIYPDKDAYIAFAKANNHALWSSGLANYERKEIISYAHSREFTEGVLPHEIAHLIFRDYVGEGNIPIWIDEGVAQWEEKGKRQFVKAKMRELLKYHEPIPIDRMMILKIGLIDNETIVELFYVQAVSLIDFLITEHGPDNFVFFCRQLRSGKDVNEALRFAYPVSIRDKKTLEAKWLRYLRKE